MYGTPSCSRKSNTVTTFGWFSEPATRASRMKRSASAGSPARNGASSLSATLRTSTGCLARYTTAMPPRPISLTIR